MVPPATGQRGVVVIGVVSRVGAARVAATRTPRRVYEKEAHVGGMAAISGPGAALASWLEAECRRLGVEISTGCEIHNPSADVTIHARDRSLVVVSTGSTIIHGLDIADVRRGVTLPQARLCCSTRSAGRSLWRLPKNG